MGEGQSLHSVCQVKKKVNPKGMNQFNRFSFSLYWLIKYSFFKSLILLYLSIVSWTSESEFSKKQDLESMIWFNEVVVITILRPRPGNSVMPCTLLQPASLLATSFARGRPGL